MRDSDKTLRRRLVDALRPLAERDTRLMLENEDPPFISAFVARHRETISELSMPAAGLVIVIEGRKEVLWGAERNIYHAGDAFVLPAGAEVDVVNEPDADTGVYRALFVRFSRTLVIEAARLWPQLTKRDIPLGSPITISPTLCSAIIHSGEALAGALDLSRRVVDHRVLEVLLILAEQGALPLMPKYVDRSITEAVRLLIRHRLDHAWSTAAVAASLSMSEATLRRRLRDENHSLRALLLTERMHAAYLILSDRDADVADAIAATGYASRSHFSRHFQDAFGQAPSTVRKARKKPLA
ncbi:helix-turn-helix domain-containing protein [Agrobacterium tumefaciens]|uniref:AraC family transcriptional regulator n=1 Tax=Agrobacterium tumefaciens TaxID=358 RepID=A0AB36EJL0_AGRTU|nr:AraC family transcriptional regulator [Agrobacterium tumefaciens]OCJ39101.1 AraC family transcriptional regulator [Agrobacterium tumefaciens]CVI23895.1 putative DNA-binding transcriptional regulator; prophage [Agrobacterium fabacearum CFBP 5771]